MKKEQWHRSKAPEAMLKFVMGKASSRKFQLFSVAACRRLGNSVLPKDCRQAINIAERYADNKVYESDLMDARTSLECQHHDRHEVHVYRASIAAAGEQEDENAATVIKEIVAHVVAEVEAALDAHPPLLETLGTPKSAGAKEKAQLAVLIRDIFYPFRPQFMEEGWKSANVRALGRTIYDRRAFDRMPILGDALEEAGCDNADILNHCRSAGPHVRGCWVVDLILGKE